MITEQLNSLFMYHPPDDTKTMGGKTQKERYELIRNHAKLFAIEINKYCPESREKSLAFTKLEEVVMWANASIARNEYP